MPRPDWFFYFLFYLLRIFKWPDSVFLGTVGVPTILLVLLIGLPFLDRGTERRLLRRPVSLVAAVLVVISMATLTWKGALAKESIASENLREGPRRGPKKQGFTDNKQALAGRVGVRLADVPHLPHVSRRRKLERRRAGSLVDRRRRPERRVLPGLHSERRHQVREQGMAVFAGLPKDQVDDIAAFLAASKGPK